MSTALAQAEEALRRYQFGLPADPEHDVRGPAYKSTGIMYTQGVHGTASSPSGMMNMLDGLAYGSIVDFYEETTDDLLADHSAQQLFAQKLYLDERKRDWQESIYESLKDHLRLLVADPTMTMASMPPVFRPLPGRSDLVVSRDLQYDALRFVSWLDDWDGENAERIHCDVAFRALEIVSRLKPEFDEPFFAPAPSGAILLQWKLSDGNVVDVFVESADSFPDCAVLTRDDSVDDVELSSLSDLRSLLRKLESASAPH